MAALHSPPSGSPSLAPEWQPVRQLLLKAAGAVQVKRQAALEERDRANLEALRDREDLAKITRELHALMDEALVRTCE